MLILNSALYGCFGGQGVYFLVGVFVFAGVRKGSRQYKPGSEFKVCEPPIHKLLKFLHGALELNTHTNTQSYKQSVITR